MTQRHMDRLSAVDATFLHVEDGRDAHMHIGGLAIFEGSPPTYSDLTAHLHRRLHLIPRYRQRLVFPPLQAGRPLWVDDANFHLEYHVRHTALPAPGGEEQLLRLLSRVFSQRLDRTKPLWELWLVEGLEDGNFALLSKTHHALVDGVAGVELMTALFDVTAEVADRGDEEDWLPQPAPSTLDLLRRGARDATASLADMRARATATLSDRATAVDRVVAMAQGIGELAQAALNPAPATPLNVTPGPHRIFALQRNRLSDLKLIKNTFGGTVNDVVISVVTGALQRFLEDRGVCTDDLPLRALVPVSVRTDAQRDALGNRLTVMLAPLPVGIRDPLQRLHVVRQAMDGIKDSRQALGAQVITAVESFAPPTLLAQASRLAFSSRMYNLLITNVPGPQFPVYLLGREMIEVFPVAFLATEHALAVAVMSYNGSINFGLLGDYDVVPDIGSLARYLDEAVAELLELARGAAGEAHEPEIGAPRAARTRRRVQTGDRHAQPAHPSS